MRGKDLAQASAGMGWRCLRGIPFPSSAFTWGLSHPSRQLSFLCFSIGRGCGLHSMEGCFRFLPRKKADRPGWGLGNSTDSAQNKAQLLPCLPWTQYGLRRCCGGPACCCPWGQEGSDTTGQLNNKQQGAQTHHFADKGSSRQRHGSSNAHVQT